MPVSSLSHKHMKVYICNKTIFLTDLHNNYLKASGNIFVERCSSNSKTLQTIQMFTKRL